ncbi:hypothetical protein ADL26_13750, partial [Thermoactinomyces vulgaris]
NYIFKLSIKPTNDLSHLLPQTFSWSTRYFMNLSHAPIQPILNLITIKSFHLKFVMFLQYIFFLTISLFL